MLISGEDYIQRLSRYRREIYVKGERISDFVHHPNIRPAINTIAFTYELAKENDRYSPYSQLVDERVNRLNYVNQTPEDLIGRLDYQRELSLRTGTCHYRCPGSDAISALYAATLETDKRSGTDFHKRFMDLLSVIQKNDLACTGALTDTKGDRSKRPIEARDMYVHVEEKREDGIVVSGAKIHQSGAFAADVNFILPTQAFKEGEEEFAIAFALLPEDEGVKYVLQNTGYQSKLREGGNFEAGNKKYGDRLTCTVILNKVLVPWERVFIFEDIVAARRLLVHFAISHRCAGAACKAGFVDSMTGAASLMLKANGLDKVPALRQRLGEMVGIAEAAYGIAIGAATKGKSDNGVWQADPLITNAGKIIGVEGFIKVLMNLAEIAGGIPVTAPSEFDLQNPDIGPYLESYLSASPSFTTEQRLKIIKFIEFWATSSHLIGGIHGGGSPTAAIVALQTMADLGLKEEAVKRALDI